MAKQQNKNTGFAIGQALSGVVIGSLRKKEQTNERARALMAFITEGGHSAGCSALPVFLKSEQIGTDTSKETLALLVRHLVTPDYLRVNSGVSAFIRIIKLDKRDGGARMKPELVTRYVHLVQTDSTERQAIFLSGSVDLVRSGRCSEDQIETLVDVVQEISATRSYSNYHPSASSIEVVQWPVIRWQSARLAAALANAELGGQQITDGQQMIQKDPLPEVRRAAIHLNGLTP